MKATYIAELTKTNDQTAYIATVLDVPFCTTTAPTFAGAVEMITDALHGCLCVLEDEKEPLQKPTETFTPKEGVLYALVEVDTLKYRAMTDTKATRKNVSLPQWMATLAENQSLNLSQVLQEALKQQFQAI